MSGYPLPTAGELLLAQGEGGSHQLKRKVTHSKGLVQLTLKAKSRYNRLCYPLAKIGHRAKTNVPTETNSQKAITRISGPHAHSRRTSHYTSSPPAGAEAPFSGLTGHLISGGAPLTRWRPNSFPPETRLKRSSDYARVFSHGRVWWHPLVSVRVLYNQQGATRIGFTVSKRLGKAVMRNLIRRRFREVVRTLPLKQGVDIVISGRPPVAKSTFADMQDALLSTFRRAGVLKQGKE